MQSKLCQSLCIKPYPALLESACLLMVMASSSKPQLIQSDLCNYDDDSDLDDVAPNKYKLDDCVLSSRECKGTWDCGPVCRDMGILNPNAIKCVVLPTKLVELENVAVVFLLLNPMSYLP
ncbi:hypothetical protein D8674_029209 [Pyrus ussuriensis x Pyrus communis]|uniref:Uncharacterized protein n=1 Tax=Pyrus ussuriensis x Pyrus communis TaxID=2448454 RepID=A0A5N5I3G0_9ROSA|nr:hypothetical protein D8674_029209 [Pyrus ussuriensis x Pyrus communis]